MIDQLRYAWAKKGLTGIAKLQPVAASRDLLHVSAKRHVLATRLCRYDLVSSSSARPISYGWLDSGPDRFLFRREFLPNDQAGHPGNFAAHVLIGPIDELPLERCLSLYHGCFWWRGPQSDGTVGAVPPLDVEDLLATVSNGSHESTGRMTEDLLTGLLAEAPIIRLAAEPDALIAAMRDVYDVLPAVVATKSFSTYEYGELAKFFGICGSLQPMTPWPQSSILMESASAARVLLSSAAVSPNLAKTLWSGLRGAGGHRMKAYRRLVTALSVGFQGSGAEMEAALPALGTPECANHLLEFASVRQAVAQALVLDKPGRSIRLRIVQALRKSGHAVSRQVWDAFDRAILDALGGSMPDSALTMDLDQIRPSNVLRLIALERLRVIDTSAPPIERWPVQLVFAALKRPTPLRGQDYARVIAVAARHARDWIARPELDVQQQADLLAGFIQSGSTPSTDMVEAGAPAFRELVWQSPDILSRALSVMPPSAYATCASLVHDEIERQASSACALSIAQIDLLDRAIPRRALSAADISVLVTLSRRTRLPAPRWGQLVADVLPWHVAHILGCPDASHLVDLRNLLQSADGVAIRSLSPVVDKYVDAGAFEPRIAALGADFARGWRRFQVDRLTSMSLLDIGRVSMLFDLVAAAEGHVVAAACLLTAAQRGMAVYGQGSSCYAVLYFLGERVDLRAIDGRGSSFGIGARREGDARSSTKALVATAFSRLSELDPGRAHGLVEHFGSDKSTRGWLRWLQRP